MEISKKTMWRILGIGSGLICLYWALNNLSLVGTGIRLLMGLLAPLIVGLAIAFILNVPMSAIEKHLFKNCSDKKSAGFLQKIKRPVSFVLALVFVLAIISLVTFLVVPELITTVRSISAAAPEFGRRVQQWSTEILAQNPWLEELIATQPIDWDQMFRQSVEVLKNSVVSVLGSTVNIASSVFSGIVNFGLGFVFSAYILLQKETFSSQSVKVLYAFTSKKRAERVLYITRLSNKIFTSFLTGQCLEAVILGSMFFVTMTIFRFPYALLVAVLISFMALIPVFGAFIGLVVGMLLMLVNNPVQALWFLVMFLALQQIEGNFIYPKVVGSSVGLPAMWVLLAVTIGGSLMGVLGMLVMVPTCSVLYALFKEAVNNRLEKKKLLAQEQEKIQDIQSE